MSVLTGQSAFTLKDGNAGTAALDIIATRVLNFINNNAVGRVQGAFSATQARAIGTGSMVYRFPKMFPIADYHATSTNTPKNGAILDVTVNLNQTLAAIFVVEQFDITRLVQGEQARGMIADSISTSLTATLDCEAIKFMNDYNIANNQYIVFPTSGTPAWSWLDPDYSDTTAFPLGTLGIQDLQNRVGAILKQKIGNFSRKISSYYIGTNPEEFIGITNLNTKAVMAGGLNYFNSFDKARNSAKNNTIGGGEFSSLETWKFGGATFFVSPFLYNNIPAASNPFRENTEYDFSNVAGIIFHRESVAMPMGFRGSWSQPSVEYTGNIVLGMKMIYGLGLLRPELMISILFAAPTAEVQAEATKNVNTLYQKAAQVVGNSNIETKLSDGATLKAQSGDQTIKASKEINKKVKELNKN